MTFINYIENLYETLDIYRAIIVINNKNIDYSKLMLDLIKNNHNPLFITNQTNEINYDYRLFIIDNLNDIKKFKKNSFNLLISFY